MSELIIERSIPDSALEPVGDGWTVEGRVVPYGVIQLVDDGDGKGPYAERFLEGAFGRDVLRGGRWVNLMLGHRGDDGDRFLGRCIGLRDAIDGCYAEFRLDRSHPHAEAARAGDLRGWSVGARVYRTREVVEDGRVVRQRELCGLNHVAATRSPQYAGAGVLVTRDHETIRVSPAPLRDALLAKYRSDRAATLAR
jgi:HK97 family phage prohead protease